MALRPFLLSCLAFAGALACSGNTVGQSCANAADCQSGQTCLLSDPGGYCTKGCSIAGDVQACPVGSICAAQDAGMYCSATCGGAGDCRAAYTCASVTPSTTTKACVN